MSHSDRALTEQLRAMLAQYLNFMGLSCQSTRLAEQPGVCVELFEPRPWETDDNSSRFQRYYLLLVDPRSGHMDDQTDRLAHAVSCTVIIVRIQA